jgi:hypothetical protein
MSSLTTQLMKWFTPPIVVPIALAVFIAGYVIYKNFA